MTVLITAGDLAVALGFLFMSFIAGARYGAAAQRRVTTRELKELGQRARLEAELGQHGGEVSPIETKRDP